MWWLVYWQRKIFGELLADLLMTDVVHHRQLTGTLIFTLVQIVDEILLVHFLDADYDRPSSVQRFRILFVPLLLATAYNNT